MNGFAEEFFFGSNESVSERKTKECHTALELEKCL